MTPLAAPLYVVTGVLLVAGLAKVWKPSATATSLRELQLPAPLASARILGVYEVCLGIAAILTGHWAAWLLVGLSYLGFSGFVLWALGDGSRLGSCGCFGRQDTPATLGHLVFNAVASALGLLAVATPVTLSSFDGSAFDAALACCLITLGITLSIASLTVLPRTLSVLSTTPQPNVQTFSMTENRGRKFSQ